MTDATFHKDMRVYQRSNAIELELIGLYMDPKATPGAVKACEDEFVEAHLTALRLTARHNSQEAAR